VEKYQQNQNFLYSSLTLDTLNMIELMLCALFKALFGFAVTFEKTAMSCGLWKSSCGKAVVQKAEDRLVEQL
jgi:hypothetical protein